MNGSERTQKDTPRRRPRTRRYGCAAAAVLALAACDAQPIEPMTRAQFIEVVTELRRIDMETDAPAEFDARRDSILSAAGVTDSALVEFARLHGRDIPYMAEVWDSIASRLASEDTVVH